MNLHFRQSHLAYVPSFAKHNSRDPRDVFHFPTRKKTEQLDNVKYTLSKNISQTFMINVSLTFDDIRETINEP